MRQRRDRGAGRYAPGFTLFEFAVSTTIIALLTGVLLVRMQTLQREAEMVKVEQTVALMRAALSLKTSQLRMRQRTADLAQIASENPMHWLSARPQNYLGEYYNAPLEDLERGNWYFDKKQYLLVYLLNSEKTFPTGTPNTLKYKVKLFHSPQKNAESHVGSEAISISLTQVDG